MSGKANEVREAIMSSREVWNVPVREKALQMLATFQGYQWSEMAVAEYPRRKGDRRKGTGEAKSQGKRLPQ